MTIELGKPRVGKKTCSYASWPNTTRNTWRLNHRFHGKRPASHRLSLAR